MDRGAWQATVHKVTELDTTEHLSLLHSSLVVGFPGGSDSKASTHSVGDLGLIPDWKDPLEKGMATHSCILAWRIPWAEEPGGHGVAKSWTLQFQITLFLSLNN